MDLPNITNTGRVVTYTPCGENNNSVARRSTYIRLIADLVVAIDGI